MDREAAPGHIGRLGTLSHCLDEVAMIELDLEGHLLEVVCRELERGLGEIDPVIVTDLCPGERSHLARVAAGNIEKGEGDGKGLVEGVVKDSTDGPMGKLIGTDELLIGRPLPL
jgi:hypothetical protein